MAQGSTIEWTEAIWNPVTGCTKVSPRCKHCYAERMATRLRPTCRFSSSNGADATRRRPAEFSKGASGTRCHPVAARRCPWSGAPDYRVTP
jgi:protein gp37